MFTRITTILLAALHLNVKTTEMAAFQPVVRLVIILVIIVLVIILDGAHCQISLMQCRVR